MSVEDIKKELISLTPSEKTDVTAFLFHLRHNDDPEYQSAVANRMNDDDRSSWLSPEEFGSRLDAANPE